MKVYRIYDTKKNEGITKWAGLGYTFEQLDYMTDESNSTEYLILQSVDLNNPEIKQYLEGWACFEEAYQRKG